MSIQPLSIPEAAGSDYAGGDVRHFAPNDGVGVPSLAGPTRNLAHRDNLISEKVNELVAVANNKEQFINLPTFRTTIPPNRSEIVTNFRIPPGMEARIFNAIVSSTPINAAEIEILYNEGSSQFGNTTGVSLVKTKNEFSNGQEFKPSGEFVVKITNTATFSADIVASIILTMRPVGALPGTPLIAAVIQGKPGKRGPVGPPGGRGPAGPMGPSIAGAPGMRWRGLWANPPSDAGAPYAVNDAVYDALDGSSYIATATPTTTAAPSTNLAHWDLLAKAGNNGTTANGFVWRGEYAGGQNYPVGSLVRRTSGGGIMRTYVATAVVNPSPTVTNPNATLDPAFWAELFGPSPLPDYGRELRNISTAIGANTRSYFAKGNVVAYTGGSTTIQLQGNGTLPLEVNKNYGRPVVGVANTGFMLKLYSGAGTPVYVEISSHDLYTGSNTPNFTITSAVAGVAAGWTYEILEARMSLSDYREIPDTGPFNIPVQEMWLEGPSSTDKGMAMLYGVYRVSFRGSLTLTLPNIAGGAKIDWKNTFVYAQLANNSTIRAVADGSNVMLSQVYVQPAAGADQDRQFVLVNDNTNPSHVSIFLFGSAAIE